MIKYYCDICGRKINSEFSKVSVNSSKKDLIFFPDKNIEFLLCERCSQNLIVHFHVLRRRYGLEN